MPAYYDFYETPQPAGSNKRKKFHARVVPTDTFTLDDLAELIHECSSLTVGEYRHFPAYVPVEGNFGK